MSGHLAVTTQSVRKTEVSIIEFSVSRGSTALIKVSLDKKYKTFCPDFSETFKAFVSQKK